MLEALALMVAQATDSKSNPAAVQSKDIVVTGRRLEETAAALRECLARHCPPDQDIAATVAHAENEFVAGDYHAARKTLLKSIGRNKRFAKSYPVPVSDLLRANARVANHLGERSDYRIGEFDAASALRAGLPKNDPRVLVQRIEVADALTDAKSRNSAADTLDEAASAYNAVAAEARAAGLYTIEGYALLRTASLYTQLAATFPSRYAAAAHVALSRLIARNAALPPVFSAAAKVLDLRLRAVTGEAGATDRLIAFAQSLPRTAVPQLIYAPPVDLQNFSIPAFGGSANPDTDFDDQWVDVSFWVRPDGTVDDPVVLRASDKLRKRHGWTDLVLKSIASRRYAPLRGDPTDPGSLRVERYTLTADMNEGNQAGGSRIMGRSGLARLAVLDLTAPAPVERAAE